MTAEEILIEAYNIAHKANDAELLMRITMVMKELEIKKLNTEGGK